jgi:hypothetical protein
MKGQHVNSRKLAGASAASVGAATAVAALLLGTLSGSAGEEPTASAFGIAAEGLVPISPTPYVQAPPDGHKAVLEVPGPHRDGLYVGLLRAEAERYRSKAQAVNVDVLGLRLKLIEAFCDHGHGDASLLGPDGQPAPYWAGETLNLSPVVRVDFNRHRREHDKLMVDAAVVTLLPADRRGMVITEKDLGLFQSLAPKSLKIPTMDQLQAAHTKAADAKSKAADTKSSDTKSSDTKSSDTKSSDTKSSDTKSSDAKPANGKFPDSKSSAPTKSSEPEGSPTVGDLENVLKMLNPSLSTLTGGPRALEEIVIASASCREEHREGRPPEHHKQEAPPPHPVKAHLPVTH